MREDASRMKRGFIDGRRHGKMGIPAFEYMKRNCRGHIEERRHGYFEILADGQIERSVSLFSNTTKR